MGMPIGTPEDWGIVERADVAFAAALNVAERGGDLEDALRDLLHVCGRRRDTLEDARRQCYELLAADPEHEHASRALELLNGALRTSLYA
jgi:hypothetical protein